MSKRQTPGVLAHVVCVLFAFVLTILTSFACLSGSVFMTVSDEAAMQRAADAALDRQSERVSAVILAQAGAQGFDPAPVQALADTAAIRAYNHELVAWWMALLRDPVSLEAPMWSCPELADTVMADEGYQANTPATMRRTIAVDTVAAAIEREVDHTALPIRASLMNAGLALVNARISVRTAVNVVRMLPVELTLAALLTALTMLACMYRRMAGALGYIGAGLMAGALVTAAIAGMVHWLDVLGVVSVMSELLPVQLGVLAGSMGLYAGIFAGAAFVLGAIVLVVFQQLARK